VVQAIWHLMFILLVFIDVLSLPFKEEYVFIGFQLLMRREKTQGQVYNSAQSISHGEPSLLL